MWRVSLLKETQVTLGMCPYGRVHFLSSEGALVQVLKTSWRTSCIRKVAQGEGCLAGRFFLQKHCCLCATVCSDELPRVWIVCLGAACGGGVVDLSETKHGVQVRCWYCVERSRLTNVEQGKMIGQTNDERKTLNNKSNNG